MVMKQNFTLLSDFSQLRYFLSTQVAELAFVFFLFCIGFIQLGTYNLKFCEFSDAQLNMTWGVLSLISCELSNESLK